MAALNPATTHASQIWDWQTTTHKPNPILYLFSLTDNSTPDTPEMLSGMHVVTFIKNVFLYPPCLTHSKCSENMK